MFTSVSRSRPRIKPTRKTALPADHRFGAGLTFWASVYEHRDHTHADECWVAREFSDSEGYLDDATVDQMAAEAELEARYERACELAAHCVQCGLSSVIVGEIDPESLMCATCDTRWSEEHDERMARRAW